MNKKYYFIIPLSIILLAFVVRFAFKSSKKETKVEKFKEVIKYVKIDTVNYKKHIVNISSYGRLKSYSKIELYSEVTGLLEKNSKAFKNGINYNNNEVLFKIDSKEMEYNLLSQKSELLNLITQILPDFKTDYPKSFNKWNNYLERFDINKKLDSLPEPNNNQEKFYISNKQIYKLYYSILSTEQKLSKYIIKAPFDGQVIQSLVDQGSLVRSGMKLGEFASSNNYELDISIPLSELNFIKVGTNVEISNDDLNLYFEAKINRISDVIDPLTQTVKAYLNLNNNKLKDGMYLKVNLLSNEISDVYKFPRKALINNKYIYVINEERLYKKLINVIKLDSEFAYITGLKEGTLVIPETMVNIIEGTKVKVIE